MKKLLMAMLVTLGVLSVTITDVEARRLGGGSSIGKQSQGASRAPTQAAPTGTAAAPASAGAAAKPSSPWKGMLGGALLGLGIGALLSHLGLGGAMGSMIGMLLMLALLGLAVMFIVRMFRNKSSASTAYAGGYPSAGGSTPEIGSRKDAKPAAFSSTPAASSATSDTVIAPWGIPADFDVPGFLRNAKTYFIRLQAAWDKADINDIREFATPEMYAELKLQIQERGASTNHTDVVTLGAELMGVETTGDQYLASVKFSGMIKESENAATEPFSEIWNLSKPVSGAGGWVLAGIQQLS